MLPPNSIVARIIYCDNVRTLKFNMLLTKVIRPTLYSGRFISSQKLPDIPKLPPKSKLTDSEREQLLRKILRVDHMGELAADRIYAGQLAVLKGTPIAHVIEHMWKDEKHHLDTFERELTKKGFSPTVFTPLLNGMAFALGAGTALISKQAAMACTIAVEELIVQHYNAQIMELVEDDPAIHADLLKTISKFRDEELEHHDTGIEHDGLKTPGYDALKNVIQGGCKAAIWLTEKV